MVRITRVKEILLLLLVYRVDKVTCLNKIEAFIGDDILLPCIYTDVDIIQNNLNLYWLDENDDNVLVIRGNTTEKYRDRVESFPKLYKKGNFSIMVRNVQQSDNSRYDCMIPNIDFHERVYLSVIGKRTEVAATPTTRPPNVATVTPKSLHMILLCLPLSLLFSHRN